MVARLQTTLSAIALTMASLGTAHAGVLDLSSLIGGANIFSFNNFSAPSADVEGAIVAGGNVSVKSYTVNLNNKDAYGHYALIAGGNLSYKGGDILNGDTYVGGSKDLKNMTTASAVQSGKSPVDFAQVEATLNKTSQSLSKLSTTAKAEEKWGGVYISGSKNAVEIIDISASSLKKSTYFDISGMAKGATLIVNVSGNAATFQGGYQAFDGYNVLFNFADANAIHINTGANVSILAPNAVINGGQGVINGNVVVNSWASQVQINSSNFFKPTNVYGYATAVPEPETYAMLLAGLGMIGVIARRRRPAAR